MKAFIAIILVPIMIGALLMACGPQGGTAGKVRVLEAEVAQLKVDLAELSKAGEVDRAQWAEARVYVYAAAQYYGETALIAVNPDRVSEAYTKLTVSMSMDPLLERAWEAMGEQRVSPEFFEFVLLERVFSKLAEAMDLRVEGEQGRLGGPSLDEFLSKVK